MAYDALHAGTPRETIYKRERRVVYFYNTKRTGPIARFFK